MFTQKQNCILLKCLEKRQHLLAQPSTNALCLFNGYYEGIPNIIVEIFGNTLVINNHFKSHEDIQPWINRITSLYQENIQKINTVLLKTRYSQDIQQRKGHILFGDELTGQVVENNIKYAIDLKLNQDCSFYLDTRNLRFWLSQMMKGKSVLNTFSYTGSFGVAALFGGARKVLQTDLNQRFLSLSKKSIILNKLNESKHELIFGDFFKVIQNFKRNKNLFDCIILDPPFFSTTNLGTIDQVNKSIKLINKVRPLIAHNGWLIIINNALFVSGQEVFKQIEELCKSEYLKFETKIKIPDDVTGYKETTVTAPPVDPNPFNHPTKIAILKVKRKDEKPSD